MTIPFRGSVNVDIKDSVPDWEPFRQSIAPEGAPSVLYIVLDDVGFSAMESFGGLIETPNINRIADEVCGTRFPHDGAVLADPFVPADWTQSHDQRDGLHHARHRRGSRTPTVTSRSSAPPSPRCWASAAGTRTWSASGTSAPRTR